MLEVYLWIVIIGGMLCFMLGFGMGANDVANNFGTSVGSKAITLRGAIVIAAIFELIGAVGFGASVTDAVRKGAFTPEIFGDIPDLLMTANLSALIAAATWLLFATRNNLSVSTSHSLVGGLVGPGMVMSMSAVNWSYLGQVILSWFIAPLSSMLLSMLVFIVLRRLIFRAENAVQRTYRFLWILLWWLCAVLAVYFTFSNPVVLSSRECDQKQSDGSIIYTKPCKVSRLVDAHPGIAAGLAFAAATALCLILAPIMMWETKRRLRKFDERQELEAENAAVAIQEKIASDKSELATAASNNEDDEGAKETTMIKRWIEKVRGAYTRDLHEQAFHDDHKTLERHQRSEKFAPRIEAVFATLQIISAAMGCLVHGANDVANAAAPFASIYSIYKEGVFLTTVAVPIWILFLAGGAISVGLSVWGHRLLRTVGIELTHMSCCRGFCCEISSAMIMIVGSFLGFPLSTTHAAIGAIIGVALVDLSFDPETHEPLKPRFWKLNVDAVNWKVASKIGVSWIGTLVVTVSLSAAVFAFTSYTPTNIDSRFMSCDLWESGCPT